MDIIVPQVGESIVEAEISQWFKQDGEQVNKDDLLLELETEKINVELNAEASGKLTILAKDGETVNVGAVIGRIDESAVGTSTGESKQEAADTKAVQDVPRNPAVEKLAAERNIDLSQIQGSGRDGRILVDDLPESGGAEKPKPAAEEKTSEQERQGPRIEIPEQPEPAAQKPADTGKSEKRTRREPMSQIRKKIAEHLLKARQQTAMLTTFNEIDMQRVIALRKNHQEAFQKKHGVPLGFMSFFVKACAEALKEFPEVNASIDSNDILYHDFYDIGIAVGSKRGLVVPIVRDADQLHFHDIEKQIRGFAEKAANGKLSFDDLQGGTFSITNGGVYGSVLSTPLLNPPQSAILGMHAIKDRAVVVDGEILVRPIMNVALSYDHRIIDGMQAVSFLKQIKTYIEDPEEMLLEM